jgi:hypothetical protein
MDMAEGGKFMGLPFREGVTHQRLLELLLYNPEDGEFYRKKDGTQSGSFDGCKGYRRVMVDGVLYKAHRLVWFYVHGVWPKNQIDHIDGCKHNNKISNLRDVSQTINMYNKKNPHKTNQSGFLGVSKVGSSFYPRLRVDNKLIHLGAFSTGEEAQAAYMKAKEAILATKV